MTGQDKLFGRGSDEWETPRDLFDVLHRTFNFTVDAAATDANALLLNYWTAANSALTQDWNGQRVWCNPPYSRAKQFAAKAAASANRSVLLLPARTDTVTWQEHIFPHASWIIFLRGRLRFTVNGKPMLDKKGKPVGAPFPSALILYKFDLPLSAMTAWPAHRVVCPYQADR